ncbi:glycosyltransferase family 2 protein [Daejeonia sp. YH14]|uniref:glycosyltransferase family 2 protein n=1 Tax=Daejeonia sp. YH14 TaxID=3439042 RepID=UPI003F491828
MPFFSIIIPLYNKEYYIRNTLECVLNQTFGDFEIVIVNDGSTDKSAEVIKAVKDERIRVFHQENQGVSAARNMGMQVADGEYFCFLDADDYWYPHFLEMFYKIIRKYYKYKIFSAAIELEVFGKIIPAKYTLHNLAEDNIYIENYFKASMGYSVLWTSSSVFHKSVFHVSGVFDTTMKSGEDTDLWIRVGEYFDIVFINKILARYVCDPQSLSRNRDYKKSSKIRYEKYYSMEQEFPEVRKFLDLNRYSEVITLKLSGNFAGAKNLKKQINFRNLSSKKKFLIHCPVFILKFLIFLQPLLIRLKIRKTYFNG